MTGASEGIGRALADALAAAGYTVTGVARDQERLRTAISALGPDHTAMAADLGTDDVAERTLGGWRPNPLPPLGQRD